MARVSVRITGRAVTVHSSTETGETPGYPAFWDGGAYQLSARAGRRVTVVYERQRETCACVGAGGRVRDRWAVLRVNKVWWAREKMWRTDSSRAVLLVPTLGIKPDKRPSYDTAVA